MNFNKTHSNLCLVESFDKGKFEFDIDKPLVKSDTHWENYIYGVINEIKKTCNNKLGGFKCFFSNVGHELRIEKNIVPKNQNKHHN